MASLFFFFFHLPHPRLSALWLFPGRCEQCLFIPDGESVADQRNDPTQIRLREQTERTNEFIGVTYGAWVTQWQVSKPPQHVMDF